MFQFCVLLWLKQKLSGRKQVIGGKKCKTNSLCSNPKSPIGFGLQLEAPHTDASRTCAGTFLELSHAWTKDNIKSRLPGLKRRNGLLLSGSKIFFSGGSKICITFGKAPEFGGWVKTGRIRVSYGPVENFHSQRFVICWCCSTVFYQSWCQRNRLPEHFMLPSADNLPGDPDFTFQQDLVPDQTSKGTKSCLSDPGGNVLDWPEPQRNI